MEINPQSPSHRKILLVSGIGVFVLLLLFFLIWQPKGGKAPDLNSNHPDFAEYIVGHTSGVISKHGTIRVQLASTLTTHHLLGADEERNFFTLYPHVDGKTVWVNSNTLAFIPTEPLKPDHEYVARFDLDKLTNVPQHLESFNFDFRVVKPSYEINLHGLKSQHASNMDLMQFSGQIYFSDKEEVAAVERLLTANLEGKPLKIKWTHDLESRQASFTIDSLLKGNKETNLELIFDGKVIRSKKKTQHTIAVPALNVFSVLDIRAVQDPDQYILVQFSDPINSLQDLVGLIEVGGLPNPRFTIDGSEVKIYGSERFEESYTVTVHSGIENIEHKKLAVARQANVHFENRLPAVSIPGKGTILPGTSKLSLPFDAVNLRAVDVTIIRIYENNVPQYLQRNYVDQSELRRVGTPVVQTTIALDEDKGLNLRRKNRFALDIDRLIKTEPGAIYRVLIGFRRSYSTFPCGPDYPNAEDLAVLEQDEGRDRYYYHENIDDTDAFWARYNNYYPDDYDWEQRDNPCHSSYYTNERWASRDMIASNIGLIAKRGNDKRIQVYTTDLISALPIAGVTLTLLDYQQQVIETAVSTNDGFASFEDPRKPFLLVASKQDERAYLKMDDGSSLPLGRFDVGGEEIQEGVKGFIYTERGVWRPGDSIYVGFILEDKLKALPKDHPVTFELLDAQGKIVKRQISREGLNGFYLFRTATDKSSPTGNWQAKIRVGSAVFTHTLKVEHVIANRLTIDLDFQKRSILRKGDSRPIPIQSKWLFGSAAKNLRAKVEVTLTPLKTHFSSFSQFHFDDPTRQFSSESLVLFDGKLDEQGKGQINPNFQHFERSPGLLQANFTSRVFEPGGAFSVDYTSLPYSPYERYLGVKIPSGDHLSGMLLTDQDHEISIVAVDPSGKLLKGKSQVQVEFYKIRWNWWWNKEDEYLGNFSQDSYNQLLKKETVTLDNGKSSWRLRVNYPDWGRYLVRIVDLEGGHSTAQTLYIDWPGWAKREQAQNPTDASMLSFTSDKKTYSVNENATLTIPTSANGRALISIENGSRILESKWIDTQAGQTNYSFSISPEMAPNIYVNVTLLQPHAQTANDLPIRMYGVIPIAVEDANTKLLPQIDVSNSVKPESKTKISVRETQGKAMTYTISLVDEGLLNLTRFATPNPHASFYAREALGVKTWDLFDQVLGAWGGELERMLSIGGDGDLGRNLQAAKANRFQSVVKVLGPFSLAKGAVRTHEITIPSYIGSLRAMVIAGNEGAYGMSEKNITVKSPLMILPTAPRVLGTDETVSIPITVFVMDNELKNVNVSLSSGNNTIKVLRAKQELRFDQVGEKTVYFDVKASQASGVGKLVASVSGGNQRASHEFEIDIRNPNPYVTRVEKFSVSAGGKWEQVIDASRQSGTSESIHVEVSTLPGINLRKTLNSLLRSPEGGLEQMVSISFPQLYLGDISNLTDAERKKANLNVQRSIDRLRGYALPDGGFSYWPGAKEADEWITNYVGHFLLEAKNKGFTVPEDLLNRWINFQKDRSRKWSPNASNWRGADLVQSYRLYGLAKAGAAEIGAMNRLKELNVLSTEATWRLATAYTLIGQPVVANQLVRGKPLTTEEYSGSNPTFGTSIRDKSMILESLSIMQREQEAEQVLLQIAQALSSSKWLDTHSTSYALLSIGVYMKAFKKSCYFAYEIDGKRYEVNESSYLYSLPTLPNSKNTRLGIRNLSEGNLEIRIIRDGQLKLGDPIEQIGQPGWLSMGVRYTRLDGQDLDVKNLDQGTDFIAEVTLKNTGRVGNYDQVILTQIFPSGWEIINAKAIGRAGEMQSSTSNRTLIQDDRVLTYFGIRENETLKYRVQLNAAYIGKFYLPSVTAEGVYDKRIGAAVPGTWVEVRRIDTD